jgi:hypothetical protein
MVPIDSLQVLYLCLALIMRPARLSLFDQISRPLQRSGSCERFIKACNPDEFSPHEVKVKALRLSVGWLENIAHKLGTFWAFPERKFLMECLLHFDESGVCHIG